VTALLPFIIAAAGGSVLTLLVQHLLRRRVPAPPAELAAVERWKPDTIRVIYEQAHEYEQALLAWADAIDGKAATIFGVAAIVAGLASTIGNPPGAGLPRLLWLVALALWGLTSVACWRAFRTREYLLGPAPDIMFAPEWAELDLDRLYVERLKQMVGAVQTNRRVIARKATALEWAIGLATVEMLLLLVALWLASSASSPASLPSESACRCLAGISEAPVTGLWSAPASPLSGAGCTCSGEIATDRETRGPGLALAVSAARWVWGRQA
jgi:hypothetical protein